ncbi:hypothetical protein MHU86_17895 [Fragilaria crotonensis]|nr:hypothetical protein MHU86_17895 [Fragilaria crotonensis]
MKAYEAIMQWTNRSVRSGHVFRDTAITSRKTVLSRVTKRLNRDRLIPVWETLYLPYSDVSVRVAYFSASAVFADLLSCRHLNADTNYIFDGDWNPDHDPYAVPNGSVIGDLNTGRSYLKTHSSLCKNPHDMLIACPLAIDKTICDVGGSGRLPLEPITMQYGLMQHDVRKKPEAMRVLGYIHPLKKDLQPAEPGIAVELAASAPLPMYKRCTNATWKVNEYHMQINFILQQSGFLSLQERGIKWNIQYRGSRTHSSPPLHSFHNRGHRGSRCTLWSLQVSHRWCRTVMPSLRVSHNEKRVVKGSAVCKEEALAINRLVHAKSFDVLQSKSQHMLVNAFDKVRFGAHSDRGIFGACPGEILHLVLLGWFKYVVKSFSNKLARLVCLAGSTVDSVKT